MFGRASFDEEKTAGARLSNWLKIRGHDDDKESKVRDNSNNNDKTKAVATTTKAILPTTFSCS